MKRNMLVRRIIPGFLLTSLLLGCGPFSRAIDTADSVNQALDLGRVEIHAGILRELPIRKRLDLEVLLNPEKVFEQIKQSRQSEQSFARSRQVSISGGVSGLIATSQEQLTKTSQDSNTTGSTETSTSREDTETTEGSDSREGRSSSRSAQTREGNQTTERSGSDTSSEASSEATTKLERAGLPKAPENRLSLTTATSTPLAAPYHQLLYATTEAVLGGRALEALYNTESIPEGYSLYSMPLVVSFEPGRVTRENYVAQADVLLGSGCGLDDITILAVAPSGFTTFNGEASLLADALAASLGATIPYKGAAISAQATAALETIRRFQAVARRPEFQVSVRNGRSVRIRYLGTEALDEKLKTVRTELQPTTFNAEVLLIGKNTSQCTPKFSSGGGLGENLIQRVERRSVETKPVPPPNGDVGQQSAQSLALGGVWSYRPILSLRDTLEQTWSEDTYGDIFETKVLIAKRPKESPRVSRLVEVPGKMLLLQAENAAEAACYCVHVEDGTSGVVAADSTDAQCVEKSPTNAQARTVSFTLATRLKKGALGRAVAINKLSNSAPKCVQITEGWAPVSVSTLDQGPETSNSPTAMSVRQARAVMESDAITVIIDIDTPGLAGVPLVHVNGKDSKVLRISPTPGEKENKHTLYIQVPQKVDPRDVHGRTLRVDITGKKKDNDKEISTSTEVTARW